MAENFKRVFAESGGKTAISDAEYADGWDFIGDQPPEVEDFNSVMNEQDLKIAEIHREGVVTYDATTDYTAATNDYTKGSDGNLYRCLINNGPSSAPVDPVGDLTGAWDTLNQGLGNSAQSWQDVKASRSASVIYTNSTAFPIMINITVNPNTTSGQLQVDGVSVAQHADQNNAATLNVSLSAVAPVGSTYELTSDGDSVVIWAELR
tara:strand:+ start:426 stop:1046 length:621 start_codon:yes stop_codon:yes gene_type:complete